MTDELKDDQFANRIAEPLRQMEHADPTFEARAMSAVHAAARTEALQETPLWSSWWLRRRTLRVSPLAMLAAAAAVVLMVLGGTLRARGGQPAVVATAAPDTVHVVRFVLVDSGARRVALVGEFNGWDKQATSLRPSGTPGVWTVDLPLRAGRHEYAFVVYDAAGEHWVADPYGQPESDEFGTRSSIISVGASATS